MVTPPKARNPQDISVQRCPDTTIAAHRTTTEDYRGASLSDARKMVREDIGHVVVAPDPYPVRDLYPVPREFEAVRQYLTEGGWLTSDGKWNPKRISRGYFERRRKGSTEQEAFKSLTENFNAILSYKPSSSSNPTLSRVAPSS